MAAISPAPEASQCLRLHEQRLVRLVALRLAESSRLMWCDGLVGEVAGGSDRRERDHLLGEVAARVLVEVSP
jgi:hypothetical protein